MGGVSEQLLTEMVRVIVREADPERVYLFGSQARAEATEDSDVDLLVVTREADDDERRQGDRIRRALAHFPVSKDIILYGVEEFEWRRTGRNNVVARAVREGRLLYERPAGGTATAADRRAGATGA